ncbi:MAG TPA: hypothetical protein VKE94_09810 [Gemmataceae bacterium]|nr:hypothetical protein [Gemmataceae bacterium]
MADDVPVLGRLPKNIAEVTRAIPQAAQASLRFQEQLDSTLRLVCWSGVAQRCGDQSRSHPFPKKRAKKRKITPYNVKY